MKYQPTVYNARHLQNQLVRLREIWPNLRSGNAKDLSDRYDNLRDKMPSWVQGPLLVMKSDFFGGDYYHRQVRQMISDMDERAFGGKLYVHEGGRFFRSGFGRSRQTDQWMKEVEDSQPDTDFVLVGAAFLEKSDAIPGAVHMDSVAGLCAVLMDPKCVNKDSKVLSLLGDYSNWTDAPHNPCITGLFDLPCYGVQSRPGNEPHSTYPVMWAA